MGNFGVICMHSIYRIALAFANIACIRFPYTKVLSALSLYFKLCFFLFPFGNEIVKPRVRAGCIIRRIGEGDNIIVLAYGETFYLPQFRQFAEKFGTEILAPFFIAAECHTQAGDRFGCELYRIQLIFGKQVERLVSIFFLHFLQYYFMIIRTSSILCPRLCSLIYSENAAIAWSLVIGREKMRNMSLWLISIRVKLFCSF